MIRPYVGLAFHAYTDGTRHTAFVFVMTPKGGTLMIANKFLYLITLGVVVGLGPRVAAQVQTDVPAAVPGAKPVSVERIKIHGKAAPKGI